MESWRVILVLCVLLWQRDEVASQCNEGDVRLQGGSSANTGRVEICHDNIWGTVCDDSWGTTDARVVCRQLQYSTTSTVRALYSGFTNGAGQIWLDNVHCTGNENRLVDCIARPWGDHNCNHNEDAGVFCTANRCNQGGIRLVGGTVSQGRVEICYNNVWGTVCDDFFDSREAVVACRQLGFNDTGAVALYSGFPNGAGRIWLDNLYCRGTENRLIDCPRGGAVGSHNCNHNEDAGVRCPTCTQGAVRLRGTSSRTFGRLEVCNNNVWGTVCDHNFRAVDAQVACRQLGFTPDGASFSLGGFSNGATSQQIWLDEVQCTGSESRIIDCPASPLGITNCAHIDDVGVRCVSCTHGSVRLQDGDSTNEGRVEVCNNNAWGTICEDGWGDADAQVVCRQLNLPSDGAVALSANSVMDGIGSIWLTGVNCVGTETSLLSCPQATIQNVSNCAHPEDIGVRCIASTICQQGDIRLEGGGQTYRGRVEFCNLNTWGTVCDDLWYTDDALVACRQLGYQGGFPIYTGFGNGAGNQRIWLDNVQCDGTEQRLDQCVANPIGVHNCNHNEDAGVVCTTSVCDDGALRLAASTRTTTTISGRVEICHQNVWGTVCDDAWGGLDTAVVCRQMGYADTGSAPLYNGNGYTRAGGGQIWLDDVACRGNEGRLLNCPARQLGGNSGCTHAEDAGARCRTNICTTGQIRLFGTTNKGRVEICRNNAWGTMCQSGWGDANAIVACRQLGFETSGSEVIPGNMIPDGSGTINTASCVGTENRLIDCPRLTTVPTSCSGHNNDVGVYCRALTCTQNAARIVGTNGYSGRLEVCNDNQWGTVCDDLFGVTDAMVACRQLGFNPAGSRVLSNSATSDGRGKIWLDNLQCQGNETSLFTCPANLVGNHNCRHSEDVGVICNRGCTQGAIRLQDGTNPTRGRVEVCNNNVWGTVCDDFWNAPDARVVCRQLGYPATGAQALFRQNVVDGASGTRIWLDNVRCRGTESRLVDCPRNAFGSHNCNHGEDAGVDCQEGTQPFVCAQDDVRLVGGTNEREGRLEVCNDNEWGTVCANQWGTLDARVACRQLGYLSDGAQALYAGSNAYPVGTGTIWLDQVRCTGRESYLFSCSYRLVSYANCNHNRDVGVRCQPGCIEHSVRIVGGMDIFTGRVEICLNNIWGSVCNTTWTDTEATVVCNELGFSSLGSAAISSGYQVAGTEEKINIDRVSCSGSEDGLASCSFSSSPGPNCNHALDAGIRCTNLLEVCEQNSLRLAGGNATFGRVEICNNNVWGTVCDDWWGLPDAMVVCRQLGLDPSGAQARYGGFTNGVGQIWLDTVRCSGTESALSLCRHDGFGNNNCGHLEDAGVWCPPPIICIQGDVRLVDGPNQFQGRVEFCYNNEWGTVCDDNFWMIDARVVCRQLGFSPESAVRVNANQVPDGNGTIWLDNVACIGTEARLQDCPANAIGTHNCGHNEDVGVRCSSTCDDGDIRLQDGDNSTIGRVEFCFGNVWGTVCDDFWSDIDAKVACIQLGFSSDGARAVTLGNGYMVGNGTNIWLDNVQCAGTESRLIECPANNIGSHNCQHFEDAGVICTPGCAHGGIRLQGSSSANLGRVEICLNNVWGTVCENNWGDLDARVVCRQLGYSAVDGVALYSGFTNGAFDTRIWLNGVRCRGTENRLIDCANTTVPSNCNHGRDAGASCQPLCIQGEIRLMGGANAMTGRVEVCNGGVWGTVCDDVWGSVDAQVACRQLGYTTTGAVAIRTGFTNANDSVPVWLDNVNCMGTETKLIYCQANGLGQHNCAHIEDAGVRCQSGCVRGDVRLRGGTALTGRVEICNNNVWGTVCDDFWGRLDATVVCRQLGLSDVGSIGRYGGFPNGAGQIWLDDVRCTGDEDRLIDCMASPLGTHNCVHNEDAGVYCQPPIVCTQGDIRLQDGNTTCGRVEVCNNNQWGTVCDDAWGTPDANVACRQLGYSSSGAQVLTGAAVTIGAGDVPIWLDNLNCRGSESSLFACAKNNVGTHNCDHSEDAGVCCRAGCDFGAVRLMGGISNREGRVEICYNNVWGTICDDAWGHVDARVVCRQLGFSTFGALRITSGFQVGSGRIWLDQVQCRGSEDLLIACPALPIGNQNCMGDHNEDAGVRCQAGCPQFAVRLAGSTADALSGRVDICYNNVWGSVCDDSWGDLDAQVVCRQLGLQTVGARARYGQFTNGVGPIWLDDVGCRGSEQTLASCPHRPYGQHNCGHSEDAGASCGAAVCAEGDLRIRGGLFIGQGRVEICHENVWGTICDDFWGNVDAAVACRQLGFPGGGVLARTGGFANGAGQIWLDNVACTGRENRLTDCNANAFGVHNCNHNEDAGVLCPSEPCREGSIRLQDGASNNTGRLEYCHNNLWGTICRIGFDVNDARVACYQLGFNRTGAQVLQASQVRDANGRQIWFDNLRCTGNELTLAACGKNSWGRFSGSCNYHQGDIGVTCRQFTPICTQGALRLVDGTDNHTGRLEVCNLNQWGTVCDDFFYLVDARVACRQLGFSDAEATPLAGNQVTSAAGNVPIWLDNIFCSGNENRLIDCRHNALGQHNCNHNEDAGVACVDSVCVQSSVRLQGGANQYTGRVEICFNNQWGTICDSNWGAPEGRVVCRQLGYSPNGAVTLTSGFTNAGSGVPIFWNNFRCNGGERRLIDCGRTGPCSSHNNDAGVRCVGGCDTGDVRITGSNSFRVGRIEICYNNIWGQICDTQWDNNDAAVACRQLGFSPTGAAAIFSGFQNSVGTIHLDNVMCTGDELTLSACPADPIGTTDCTDVENAGVRCELGCENGDLRLADGYTNLNGRVEICYNNTWGTICDDFYGRADANVICKQLGFRPTDAVPQYGGYPDGIGVIWLSELRCTGVENNITECNSTDYGVHHCDHREDIFVQCRSPQPIPVCAEGQIRLQGGTATRGRVEICYDNTWGTVCDDFWGAADARVACRQLGHSTTGATILTLGSVPDGTGQIWLDNVQCTGSEARLIDCPANTVGVHNCVHREDAGVNCQALTTCTNGDLRLVGGALFGRIEMCYQNTWGTVCSDGYSSQEAAVACRQLGFSESGAIPLYQRLSTQDPFTAGSGRIWLDNLNCNASERRLIECPRGRPIGNPNNCNHAKDVGVRCEPIGFRDVCKTGQVRLANGGNPRQGRVEICYYNQWGTICDDAFGFNEAKVICKQLGWANTTATAYGSARFGQGTGPIVMDNVGCTGTESDIMSCPFTFNHNCNHREDASVTCYPVTNTECNDGDVRINYNIRPRSYGGRVEVCNDHQWGTICHHDWGFKDSLVVCRQLGWRGISGTAGGGAYYGQGSGNIWLDQVRCQGYEDNILNCPANPLGRDDCTHAQDAGTTCGVGCADGDLRLAGGRNATQGRVEICYANVWGTVCDDFWSTGDARVVCRQLGFGGQAPVSVHLRAAFGQGGGPILLDNVRCTGTESRLLDCPANSVGTHNCVHSEDAGVTCNIGCVHGSLRLVGGALASEGRVEICNDGGFGTVCDDFWGNADAAVVCRQLGFTPTNALAISFAAFGQGTGQIVLDNVNCAGTEERLIDCPANPLTVHNCAHSEDASVRCSTPCTQGALRLANGMNGLEGRVEICNNNQWGTVCDDAWGTPDATVVCRQLGFSTTGAQAFGRATFGRGVGSIVLDQVNCAGTEARLTLCPANPIGVHDCSHFEDAGVRCQNGTTVCTQGALRLRGGSNEFEGRVEVCNNNGWGTVCDDFWGTVDAGVACRQLGYSFTGATAFSNARFGQGTGPIWLDNVQCTGNEITLISCQNNGLGTHNCVHAEDAGVRCIRSSTACNTGDLRLVNGTNSNEGRIEVCRNNVWGTVCDDFWSFFDATVACRQLGFSITGATALARAPFGQGTGPILLDNVFCTGTQVYLINCTHNGLGNHNCVHSEDAGLRCPNNNTVTCTNGDIRLVGGSNNFQGRVEICWNNQWGTVCDDFWGNVDAQVVCRQLGYRTTGATAIGRAGFGQGASLSAIVIDNVGCIGTESRLIQCSNSGIGRHNCAHSEDAGVTCPSSQTPACANGDIRLVGGANIREGRVEFCNNGLWGTVCDDAWDTLDANVVCRQLGFSPFGNTALIRAFFGQGTGLIWLDNVNCAGTESRLADCPANPIGSHNCIHSEDAGVRCQALGSVTPACTTGDVRLAGTGASTLQGRVEFCSAGVWGTVCDDLWGTPDANVVCRQLGFSGTGSIALSFAAFGQGTGPILLDNVGCLGTERRLADCPANPIGSHNCVHFEDASVSCVEIMTATPAPVCLQNHIRLVGGTNALTGRVELCNNNAWGTACNSGFGTAEANVACRQLGFSGSGATFSTGSQGTGLIVLANLRCVGNESSLFFCPGATIGSNTCTHSQDVSVTCGFVCVDGDIRLVGGTNDREGRVEVCDSQVWGTVCDDFWSSFDAGVTCIQLGYARTGATALSRAPFGQGTGPILLDNLFCRNTETRLVDCPHNGIGVHNCVHSEDAGVRCAAGCQRGSVRLVSGTSTLEGRVEICINNAWGTVCDDSWDNNDASVVCRQLGYSTLGAIGRSRAFYGQGTGTIQLDDVRCTGSESRLIDCPANAIGVHNCAHSEDAGVTCRPETTPPSPPCTDWDLRLVGGRTVREGRVEVCRNATWGTVCDDFWNNPDASVVCAQLGYARNGALALSFAAFGQGTGPIYLDNVMCTGTELNIRNCSLLTTHNCVHSEDASVICIVCDENSVRLVGSANPYEGRVEVCINQAWGTVCDDAWGTPDATVVCRQAGFSRFGAQSFGNARYGQGSGPILLDNVNCVGNESRLVDCGNNGIGIHNCAHFEDASVRCNQTLRCNHGSLRLAGSAGTTGAGRVELCANETWGTICSDAWGDVDANVVCRILGYSRFNATAVINAFYGQGSGPIILTNVGCTGSEINLLSCPYSTATTGCTHAEDASVECSTTLFCNDGDIRLVGGRTMLEGRVEVCRSETWGTVCDDFWNAPDANVVCRQLGFNDTGATALLFAAFGQGTGPILVDDVRCVGTEQTLLSCPHITQHNCIHFEDASVRCLPPYVPCSSGDVRLTGGTTSAEGRVEFCQTGNWGTVCDDSWGIADARVVCRQLGYTTLNAAAFGNARFGRGTGPIYLDEVRCTGRETRLADCPANPIAVHDCSHSEDAGVYCQVCEHGDIRLVNGRFSYEGRVEVCVNNTWGTVCDDFWNAPDAQVVCRQAGFQATGATALSFMPFGQGIDPILLDDVRCIGTESMLLDCPYNPNHNCVHLEDAGVRCVPFPCQNGALRLSDGATNNTGRVEICRSNDWGTICNSGFDRLESSVICRQLGFSSISSTYTTVGTIPAGTGTISLTNLMCTGTEATLSSCRGSTTTSGCDHTMDVVVTCRTERFCNDADLRLVNGNDRYEGRVEICFNETWGTICDGFWSTNDAIVVCRQLGFATNGAIRYLNAFFGQGTGPIYLDDFLCTGRESRLINCRNGGLNRIDFCRGHLDDAGVRCAENCTHGEVRLADGQSSNEGRVELCFNGIWGTVCDDFFGSPDAQVVCAQLGYSRTGAQAFSFAFFGQGTGPIHIDDVGCRGNEPTLLSCPYNPRDNCIHAEDTGVRCQGCANGDVRLVGGTSLFEGRVEVCSSSTWGTVCDDLWGAEEATVVCRQLGYSQFGAVPRVQAYFGAGTGQILLDNVNCDGSEDRLIDCMYITQHNCNHGEDAGVTCASAPRCEEGDLRLADGTTQFNGRVELCLNETWGTVCQDGWDVRDAKVVCRQLGLSVLNPAAQFGSAFTYPYGTGPIYYDNAGCVGTEPRLLACHYDMHTADCTHTNDVGVDCRGYPSCSTGDIRLVNGTTEFEGRVELCVDEVWGTICDQAWSTFDATVACRQLGFNPVMARPEYDAFFGRGTGPIWLDDLFCNSFETRLIDCRHGGINMTDFCNGHNDDAGLFCLEGCTDDQVRLIGGSGPYEGRVEFCRARQWGTVCHDNWGDEDATVVCRQLGYSVINATSYTDAYFGPGTGGIFLDNVACVGTEATLATCVADTNTGDCVHAEDASVTCNTDFVCSDGDVRLEGGTLPSEGRVEVCLNEVWGTICDTNWGIPQAQVVCSSLGFSVNGAAGISSAFFGQGTMHPINLDNVVCTGQEDSLTDCMYNSTTITCTHASDASVRCSPTPPSCKNWDLRIVNSDPTINNTGRLDVCIRENWNVVCNIGWEQADANVACRQLGFSRFGATATSSTATGSIYPFTLACTGNETRLRDCPRSTAVGCGGGQIQCNSLVCNDEDIRITGGPSSVEGRVEICYDEVWGTICDNSWTTTDANVACLQLGFLGIGAVTYPNARYGQGTGPIYLNNLRCTGSEVSLADCDNDGLGVIGTCTHADDAAMFCETPCTSGDIRLRDGNNPYEGRVEVCVNEIWGTVCDDFWSGFDARVACRQLGFSEFNATAIPTSRFGVGTGPIHLDDLLCNGFEDRLVDCAYDSNTADCVHFEDAALRCRPCDDGEIRLEGGTSFYNGRVEICQAQNWFGVCNTFWSAVDASVACRHLNYSGFGAVAYTDGRFGEGQSQILLDQVNCTGSELSLFACSSIRQVGLNCPQTSSAAIECRPQPVCIENSTRLVGGRNDLEGRVEICVLETWRTICNVSWTPEDAGVVCRQLGFSRHNATIVLNSTAMFGQGNGAIYAQNIRCHGEEGRLLDCPLDTNTASCSHAMDAGVRCNRDLICQNGDLRLVNGSVAWVGRVELCWNETWGTVCDQFWSVFDANVACRQLGYAPIGRPRYNAFYGQGTGPLLLDDLICRNTESRLVDCFHGGVGMTDFCRGHLDDAGLDCRESCTSGAIRLVGGNDAFSGRLEVCKSQNWGTVCDDVWDNLDATVACRQLGYSSLNSTALVGGQVPEGTGSIHFDNVMCTGTESSLFDCTFDDTPNCNHREDAGVICLPTRICDNGDLRLVGGNNPMEGRVEVCQNEVWGTVCDSLWSSNEGRVTCRQLGFSQFGSVVRSNSFYGPGLGPITIGSLQCVGSEARLYDCPRGDISTCTHTHDAGVACRTKICDDGDVRLVAGTNPREGRVEVCYREQFGTVCDIGFGTEDARVVCGQLGFSRIRATGIPGGIFDQGGNQIWLTNLNCTGSEDNLLNCPTPSTIGLTGCLHAQDAGVICDPRISYPQNVSANSPTNTTVVVTWDAPLEFYSNITKYTVNCTNGLATRMVETPGPNVYSATVPGLSPYTQYRCCSTARYSNPIEDATACANVVTRQGIPGRPVNLTAMPLDPRVCGTIQLSWDQPQPSERNGVITGYTYTATSVGADTSFSQTMFTPDRYANLTGLSCCTNYQYSVTASTSVGQGTSSTTQNFRTPANNLGFISVGVSVTSRTSLTVNWNIPQNVSSQGLDTVAVAVTPVCVNGLPLEGQQFTTSNENTNSNLFSDLLPTVPYRVSVSVSVCQSLSPVYINTVYTERQTLLPPKINSVSRTGSLTSQLTFSASPSNVEFDYYAISLYAASGSGSDNLNQDLMNYAVSNLTGTPGTLTIDTLMACTAYWVQVTGVTCGGLTNSDSLYVPVLGNSTYQASLTLVSGQTCDNWINSDRQDQITSRIVNSILRGSTCGFQDVSCVVGTNLSCTKDQNRVTVSITLASTDVTSSGEQLNCLYQWGLNSPGIFVDDIQYTLKSEEIATTSTPSPTQAATQKPAGTSGSNLGYVYAIVAICVVGLVIGFLLVIIVVLVIRRRDKPAQRKFDERMLDDQDDVHSTHSIGIVENPLYAEQEEYTTPSYAALKKKEAEADEDFGYDDEVGYEEKGDIHFDPPHDDY